MSANRTIHFPPATTLSAPAPEPAKREYQRPDISLLRSIIGASEQIREELKILGDEQTYETGLRVLKTQGTLIADLAAQLLDRYEKAAL